MKTTLLPRRRARPLKPLRPDHLFLVDLMAVTPKDIIPHLEHPFFGLAKQPWKKNGARRRYDSPSGQEYVELLGNPDYGLPTIFDQDYLIYAASVWMAEAQQIAGKPARERPSPPPRWRHPVQRRGVRGFHPPDGSPHRSSARLAL